MRCQNCRLCQSSLSQVIPCGSNNPLIYFAYEYPKEDDTRYASITGSQGIFIDSYMKAFNLAEYRKFSLVRCSPYDVNYPSTTTGEMISTSFACQRSPLDDEVQECKRYLMNDISATKPKVIVTFGELASKSILGDNFNFDKNRGEKVKATINMEEFIVVPTFPIYEVLGNSVQPTTKAVAESFFNDIKKAVMIANGTYIDIMEDMTIKYASNYSELKDYVVNELLNEPEISYDIETNAELVYSDKFDVIGFSLGKKRSGVYVCLDSLEYTMPKGERELCENLLIQLLKSKNIIVHNSNYERPATYYRYGYELTYEQVTDTLVMAKLLLGGKIGAGLKPNARKIGYPDWDSDLSQYIEAFKNCISRLGLVKYRPILEMMRNGDSLDRIYFEISGYDWATEIADYIFNIKSVCEAYYTVGDPELDKVYDLIPKKIVYGFDNGIPGTIPYNWIPKKLICKYGAIDAIATVDLKEHFLKRFDDESTEEVNLHKGYTHALAEHFAGYAMMMASLKWDDESAQVDDDFMFDICVSALKYLCKNDLVLEWIISRSYIDLAPDIIYEDYNDYFEQHLNRRVYIYKDDGEGNITYKLVQTDPETGKEKKVHIKHLMTDVTLPPSIDNDIRERMKDIIVARINTTDDLDVLKGYFNPASTVSEVSDLATEMLLTDEFRFAKLIQGLHILATRGDYVLDKLNANDRAVMDKVVEYMEIEPHSTEDWLELKRTSYEELKATIKASNRFSDKEMQVVKAESINMFLEGLDDTSQIMIYEALKYTPIDTDDPSTWTDLFKTLIAIRCYKKAYKIRGSYINGKVGRKSVMSVDTKAFVTGEDICYRTMEYEQIPKDSTNRCIMPSDQTLMLQTSFGVGTAETGRWRSAFHVIPSGSTVKRLYKSRFKGGTILQPDFSANELRCVASASNEENMLEAFRQGVDIHKSNASKIYNKPLDEVTAFERRYAKTASFAILYGSSAKSISDQYFNGDQEAGAKLMNDFYEAFPALKKWIELRHKEVMETGKVSVLTNRFLNITFDRNDKSSVNSAMRQAQNYPIQSSSSTMAACIFSDIIRYQRSHNMKSKPILFIHDSLETDVYPYELFEILLFQKDKLATGAIKDFGIACKADISMGISLGHECELEDMEVLEGNNEGYLTLSGWYDEIMDTIDNWKLAYNVVDIVEEDWKESFIHMDQFMIPRKSFDPTILTTRKKGHCKVHIRYFDENGTISPITDDAKPSYMSYSNLMRHL